MKLFIIILLFLIPIYSFSLENNYIINNSQIEEFVDNNNINYLYDYLLDYKYIRNIITDYDYKICIHKYQSINKNNPIYKKNNNYININNISKFNNIVKLEKKIIKDNFYFYKYKINNNESTFKTLILKDNNIIIWDYTYLDSKEQDINPYIIDAYKTEEGYIVISYKENTINIQCINNNINKNKLIVYETDLPYDVWGEVYRTKVIKCIFISNNLIKLIFDNKSEEIWQIYPDYYDYEEYLKINPNRYDLNAPKCIWWNELGNVDIHIKPNKHYNYFEQDTEPTIEQLKEKFPDDTFFR